MLPEQLDFAVRSEEVYNQHRTKIPGYDRTIQGI